MLFEHGLELFHLILIRKKHLRVLVRTVQTCIFAPFSDVMIRQQIDLSGFDIVLFQEIDRPRDARRTGIHTADHGNTYIESCTRIGQTLEILKDQGVVNADVFDMLFSGDPLDVIRKTSTYGSIFSNLSYGA